MPPCPWFGGVWRCTRGASCYQEVLQGDFSVKANTESNLLMFTMRAYENQSDRRGACEVTLPLPALGLSLHNVYQQLTEPRVPVICFIELMLVNGRFEMRQLDGRWVNSELSGVVGSFRSRIKNVRTSDAGRRRLPRLCTDKDSICHFEVHTHPKRSRKTSHTPLIKAFCDWHASRLIGVQGTGASSGLAHNLEMDG